MTTSVADSATATAVGGEKDLPTPSPASAHERKIPPQIELLRVSMKNDENGQSRQQQSTQPSSNQQPAQPPHPSASIHEPDGIFHNDDDDDDEYPAHIPSSLLARLHTRLVIIGWCPQFVLHGDFARRMEWAFRIGISLILALFFTLYQPIASQLPAIFLCPVFATLACQQSIGASINIGWQVAKGTSYAAIFGFIMNQCGVNYANDSRWATGILLVLFTMWSKYFMAPSELTSKKLAVGLGATIFLQQLNYPQTWAYPFWILCTSMLGSGCGIVASIFPFPKPALKDVEERWQHALGQTVHLFRLIIKGFTCTSQAEVQARMIPSRIEQTIQHLLANRDDIKLRMREAEHEFPVIFYRFFCGTYNNYTYERLQQHFQTFDHLYRYMKCMAFSLQTLPYDSFHNACIQYLKRDLMELCVKLEDWMTCILDTDQKVHRSKNLDVVLEAYSKSITDVLDRYLQFRADMYFEGKLFLVDLYNGRQAVLRKSVKRVESEDEAEQSELDEFPHEEDQLISTPVSKKRGLGARKRSSNANKPGGGNNFSGINGSPKPNTALAGAIPIVPMKRHRSGESQSRVQFQEDPSAAPTDDLAPTEPTSTAEVRVHLEPNTDSPKSKSRRVKPSPTTSADAKPTSEPQQQPQQLAFHHMNNGDFTWTSEDIISLNFFMFQLNEFTRRSLKFRMEPKPVDHTPSSSSSFDPLAYYHLHSVRQLPRWIYLEFYQLCVAEWANAKARCVWDPRLFIESCKLALAILLSSLNELVPQDWPPLYERTSHGFWAPVTVAFVMADSLGGHFSSMVMRVLGTFVGAIAGYLAAKICQQNTIGLIATLVVWNACCTYGRVDARFGYAHLVAGFTAIVVAVGTDPSLGGVSALAFVRIQETLVGVIIGMVIHNLILPFRASRLIHSELLKNIKTIAEAFEYSFGKYQNRAGEFMNVNLFNKSPEGKDNKPTDSSNALINNSTIPNVASSSALSTLNTTSPDAPLDYRINVVEDVMNTHLEPERDDLMHTADGTNAAVHTPILASDKTIQNTIDANTSKSMYPSPLVQLNPGHSFKKLGPQVFSSIDTQSMLCTAASLEPTLWGLRFPEVAYQRIISIERNIALYLYCMDLALQRIAQSGSMYLMPDLDQNFTKLKKKCMASLEQIRLSVESYTEQLSDEQQEEQQSKDHDDHQLNSPHGSMHNLSPLAHRLRAQSVAQKDDLLSLNSSLLELETRYKLWIDQRILAKRKQIHEEEGGGEGKQEFDDDLKEPRVPSTGNDTAMGVPISTVPIPSVISPSTVIPDTAAAATSSTNAPSSSALPPSDDHLKVIHPSTGDVHQHRGYGFLTPIPLDTPKPRQLASHQSVSVSRMTLEPTSDPTAEVVSPPLGMKMAALELAKHQSQPTTGTVNERAPKMNFSTNKLKQSTTGANGTSKKQDLHSSVPLEATAGLQHMDVTFTRSMDVLALNTFLFSTRGLIREIISLSQAVRVLLHMRHPGPFEEAF